MKPLRSLDLFAGIGGFTHALRGIATPLAYCEVDAHARDVLQANMAKGRLPSAPICHDVRALDGAWMRRHGITARQVDMVTAGFPCTGMSIAGARHGFANDETALFYDMLRVIDQATPTLVVLENSPHVITAEGVLTEILKQLTRRGYEVRYTVMGAHLAGAPHRRARWYCMAIKPRALGARLHVAPSVLATVRPHRWTRATEPARMVPRKGAHHRERLVRLGMSVVPDVVRRAFVHMAQGFQSAVTDFRSGVIPVLVSVGASVESPTKDGRYPPHAVVTVDGRVQGQAPVPYDMSVDWKLTLSPSAFRSAQAPSTRASSGFLDAPVQRALWGTVTPRDAERANHHLTRRGASILVTQVRFEARTHPRTPYMAPEFGEWMMGYPPGWTRLPRTGARTGHGMAFAPRERGLSSQKVGASSRGGVHVVGPAQPGPVHRHRGPDPRAARMGRTRSVLRRV